MRESTVYERFPRWSLLVSNLPSVLVAGIGAFLLEQLYVWLFLPYLVYLIWAEGRVLRHSCVDCAYYGGGGAFGKGRLCALLFKKGDPERFAKSTARWTDVLPDFLAFLVPLGVGIALLVRDFSWVVLGLVLLLGLVSSVGNGVVRGSFACRHCRQRAIGCPAARLFGRTAADS